jgi:hypothetical protein
LTVVGEEELTMGKGEEPAWKGEEKKGCRIRGEENGYGMWQSIS